jgi:ATP-dependent DNA helicase Q5
MGVDKASVRVVAHWSAPVSVAAYAQESGRAGRDGKEAFGRIYYSEKDRDNVMSQLKNPKNETIENQTRKKDNFKRMVKYCEGLICRHSVLSDYFGDPKPNCIDQCDICEGLENAKIKLDKFLNGAEKESIPYMNANIELSDMFKSKFSKRK